MSRPNSASHAADARSESPGSCRWIDAEEARAFATGVLLSPERAKPVVAVTTDRWADGPTIDPAALAEELGDAADVVVLKTGDATWALTEALPKRLDVYGGAVRIWWPGLTLESSYRDHPLLFVKARADALRVVRRVLREILGESADPARVVATPGSMTASVERVEDGRVYVRASGVVAPVVYSDIPVAVLAASVRPGQPLPVRQAGRDPDGEPIYSARGLLPSAWDRIEDAYRIGDVVPARVHALRNHCAVVELLPAARAVVPIKEVDWDFVKHPADILTVGEVVPVEILDLDVRRRRCLASIRNGRKTQARPGIALIEGGPVFAGEEATEQRTGDLEVQRALRERVQELEDELASVTEDRSAVVDRLRDAMRQLEDVRQAQKRAEAERAAVEDSAGGDDPLSSERSFLLAVRVAYARAMGEGDRHRFSLERMRVGREFLERARGLAGISVEKIVEVCAQVACQRAHKIRGREVHQLRAGEAGASVRTRASDDAKAWRCSLQDNTPSARRLHWWDIPGEGGRTIEFASVAVHDDFSIPE